MDWGWEVSRENAAIVVTVSRNDGALNYGGSSWDGASYPVRLWEFLKDVKFKAMSLTLVMGAIDCRLPPTSIFLLLSSRPLLLISFSSVIQEWASGEAEPSPGTRTESDWPTGNPSPQSENGSEWTCDPKAANGKWQ